MTNGQHIPLFPLNTVLFKDGLLPLRIFEPRYTRMISHCMRSDCGFGICLIEDGSEIGQAAQTHLVGTLVQIEDFEQLPDGLLGITVRGGQRFQVESTEVGDDQLIMADITRLEDEPEVPLPEEYQPLLDAVTHLISRMGYQYDDMDEKLKRASWVGHRLAELLPIPADEKQRLLQMNDAIERLAAVYEQMKLLQILKVSDERLDSLD